jgi:hypothetical protein
MNPGSDTMTPNSTPPPDSFAATPEPPSNDSYHKLTIYSRQVRAFLEASEDVEIDADTVQDILEGFPDGPIDIGVDVEGEDDEAEEEDASGADVSELSEFDMEGM